MKLIALDMDGTLLDGAGKIPPGFEDVVQAARDAGVVMAPASGRQLKMLQEMFAGENEPEAYIAENGTVVAFRGEVISTTTIPMDPVRRIVAATEDAGLVTVVCHPTVAHIPAGLDADSAAEIDKYYAATQPLEDLQDAVTEDVVKVAVYAKNRAEQDVYPVVQDVAPELNVVVSGAHWVDVMDPSADKGVALRALAQAMDVDMADTAAFGDYLNDYALLQAAGTAYAMENAHPELKAIADHIAPSNEDHGVLTVLRQHFGMA